MNSIMINSGNNALESVFKKRKQLLGEFLMHKKIPLVVFASLPELKYIKRGDAYKSINLDFFFTYRYF